MRLSWSLLLSLVLGFVLAPAFSSALAADPLRVTLTTNKADYNRGDTAQFTVTVTNTSSTPVVVTFTTAQKYDFSVRDASGATVWTWSQGQVFSPLPSQQTLAAGASWTYSTSWSFTTNLSQRIADGAYTVRGVFTGEYVGKSGTKAAEQPITYFTPDYLQLSVSTDKTNYQRGEQATLTLSVTNTAPYALTVSFATSQQYDFTAVDASGNAVWSSSAGRSYDPVPSSRTLSPGETWVMQEVWNFRDNAGAKVLDGDYAVTATFLGDYEGRGGTKAATQVINLQTSDPLLVTFSTDKASYGRLDTAKLKLRVVNVATYPVTITFPTSQLYDFSATNSSGSTVWTWSYGKTFSPQAVELVLNPDEAVEFQESWNLMGNNGLPAPAGTYKASGVFLGNYTGKPGPKGGSSQLVINTL